MSGPLYRASAGMGHVEAAFHSLREARKVMAALAEESSEPEVAMSLQAVSEALQKTISAVGATEAALLRVIVAVEAHREDFSAEGDAEGGPGAAPP